MGEYRLDLLDRIDALDGLLADAQSEAKSHADAAANYARELTEARALVRELVEVGDELWDGGHIDAPDAALFRRWQAAKARASGYTEEGE